MDIIFGKQTFYLPKVMSETKLAIRSSIFTVLTLALCESILFHYLPKDNYGSYVYMRFNLLTILGLFFACNFTFISAAFRYEPAKTKNIALKKSIQYSFLIAAFIIMQLLLLHRQVETGLL